MPRIQDIRQEAQGKTFCCRKQPLQDKLNNFRPLKLNCAKPCKVHWFGAYYGVLKRRWLTCFQTLPNVRLGNWAFIQLGSKWSHAKTWGHLSAGMRPPLCSSASHTDLRELGPVPLTMLSPGCAPLPAGWLIFIAAAENCKYEVLSVPKWHLCNLYCKYLLTRGRCR